jgi:hypothetical protein
LEKVDLANLRAQKNFVMNFPKQNADFEFCGLVAGVVRGFYRRVDDVPIH